jgi:hypothetical protein
MVVPAASVRVRVSPAFSRRSPEYSPAMEEKEMAG